jgi:hypothetical protein
MSNQCQCVGKTRVMTFCFMMKALWGKIKFMQLLETSWFARNSYKMMFVSLDSHQTTEAPADGLVGADASSSAGVPSCRRKVIAFRVASVFVGSSMSSRSPSCRGGFAVSHQAAFRADPPPCAMASSGKDLGNAKAWITFKPKTKKLTAIHVSKPPMMPYLQHKFS